MKVLEVFWRFFILGWISFGGPMAHIGYFRKTFVEQLQWLDDSHYSRLVALSQFLPGPGSSQVGFAIGLRHAGIWGGWAAFLGFTLPSFLLLYFVAVFQPETGEGMYAGIVQGLKLLAVVVVADAVLGMFSHFCRDKFTISVAVLTAVSLWLMPDILTQLVVLLMAALLGRFFYHSDIKASPEPDIKDQSTYKLPLIIFTLLLLVALAQSIGLEFSNSYLVIFNDFFQAGSLVFGGGHVVLPLLQEILSSKISLDDFLTGYAMAQAVPGPMFTFASFLGAVLVPQSPFVGAVIATAGIFLPGLLLILALQNVWNKWADNISLANSVALINAAVVGLLIAAFYQPVFMSSIHSPFDLAFALIGLTLLRVFKLPVLVLVLGFILVGIFLL